MRKTFLVALAMTGFLAYGPEQSAKADSVQFNDLSDSVTVVKTPVEGTPTETISIEAGPTCTGETCSITIRGENSFAFTGATSTFPFTRVDATHSYMTILDPTGGVSDVVLLDTTNASEADLGAVLTFLSDTTGTLSGFATPAGSPVENGTSQNLFSLSWQDQGLDADTALIFVQSDIAEGSEAPEPATLGLLAVGLAALGVIRLRKAA